MAGGSTGLTEVVNAPLDKVVSALTDFESFPQWQSAVLECEVQHRDADGRGTLVRMKVDAKIRRLEYVVRYSYDLPNGLAWQRVAGDLKRNDGRFSFLPRADGGTDVTLDIAVELGFFLPGPMMRVIRDQSLANSMRDLRRRVETAPIS